MEKIAEIIDNNTIYVYDLSQFDIDAIMHSGQVFRYFEKDGGYQLIAGNNFADIFNDGGKVIIESNDSGYFFNYFDLQTDYNEIKSEFFKFEKIAPAVNAGGGIRILRAVFGGMGISCIISANNNIKRFTKTLNLLAENYGDKLSNGQYAFPSLKQLSGVTEADFKALGCGYRDRYLVKAIQQLNIIDSTILNVLPNDRLARELLKICGVGPKVCACIMLFCGSFHRLDTAPIDTWINKALNQLSENEKTAILNHKYAGVAQQYIFYWLQHLRNEL